VDRHTAKKGLKEKSALLPKALQKSPVVQRRGHEIKRDETFLPLSLPKTMGILKKYADRIKHPKMVDAWQR